MSRSSFRVACRVLAPAALVLCGCVPAPQLLLDLDTTNQSSWAQAIVPTGSGFYLVATRAGLGEELFYTPDGTIEGATPENLIDVRPGALSSSPRSVYTLGERAFFSADDGSQPNAPSNPRQGLFVTDGTKSSTVRLRDPAVGLSITGFAPWGSGGMLFRMSDASTGAELYRTDGTPGGIQMIADINPSGSSDPLGMTGVGGVHVFAATDGSGDREPWRTDGMTATRLSNLNPAGSSAPTGFVAFGGKVYFTATISPGTMALYATDGTTAGTARVSTLGVRSLVLGTATSSHVFFIVNESLLWVSDGTSAGTVFVEDIPLNSDGRPPREFRTVGDRVLFSVETDESDMDVIDDVWSSDGTAAGTFLLLPSEAVQEHGVLLASRLYLTAGSRIYRTDGTAGGTEIVHDAPAFGPRLLTDVHGALLLSGNDASRGNELWKMGDGLEPPTFFCDVNHGNGSSYPSGFTPFGDKTLFNAWTQDLGTELWITDGTPEGTAAIGDIWPGYQSGAPGWLAERDGIAYFNAQAPNLGFELWRTDGTAAGTYLVTDLNPGEASSTARPYAGPSTVFLHAANRIHDFELWRTDGTAAGTVLLKDIYPGTTASRPSSFATIGSQVVFTATTPDEGSELWRSDGTSDGTVLVKDINPGAGSSDIYVTPVRMGGHLYFAADDGVHGREVWRTDGTTSGTTRVTDVGPGTALATRGNFVALGNELFFDGNDGAGVEIWKTDGVTATKVTGGINPGGSGALPGVAVGGTLYFVAMHPQNGSELFATDGTAAGVRLVKDINPTPGAGSSIDHLAVLGDFLYFSADNGVDGSELWRTDGTTDGTVMSSGAGGDPFPGAPRYMTGINGKLYLSLTDPVTGAEPYILAP